MCREFFKNVPWMVAEFIIEFQLENSCFCLLRITVDPVSSGQHKINRQQHNST